MNVLLIMYHNSMICAFTTVFSLVPNVINVSRVMFCAIMAKCLRFQTRKGLKELYIPKLIGGFVQLDNEVLAEYFIMLV